MNTDCILMSKEMLLCMCTMPKVINFSDTLQFREVLIIRIALDYRIHMCIDGLHIFGKDRILVFKHHQKYTHKPFSIKYALLI